MNRVPRLHAGVASESIFTKLASPPTPPAQTQRDLQVGEVGEELLRRQPPGVAAGAGVDADEPVHAALERLERPLALGDVVVDDAPGRVDLLHHEAGVAQRGDEEAHALLERDVHPAAHPVQVDLGGLLHQGVEATGLEVRRRMSRRPSRRSWPCT
jgi:hypothetical protein